MLTEFEADPFEETHTYRALQTLRDYKPQGLGKLVKL